MRFTSFSNWVVTFGLRIGQSQIFEQVFHVVERFQVAARQRVLDRALGFFVGDMRADLAKPRKSLILRLDGTNFPMREFRPRFAGNRRA